MGGASTGAGSSPRARRVRDAAPARRSSVESHLDIGAAGAGGDGPEKSILGPEVPVKGVPWQSLSKRVGCSKMTRRCYPTCHRGAVTPLRPLSTSSEGKRTSNLKSPLFFFYSFVDSFVLLKSVTTQDTSFLYPSYTASPDTPWMKGDPTSLRGDGSPTSKLF